MSSLIDEVLAFARDEMTTDRVELRLSALAKAAWAHVDTGEATLRRRRQRTRRRQRPARPRRGHAADHGPRAVDQGATTVPSTGTVGRNPTTA